MDGFRRRASDIDELFHDPATTVPRGHLSGARTRRGGHVLHAAAPGRRSPVLRAGRQPRPPARPRSARRGADRRAAEAALGARLAGRVARTHAELQVLARRDAAGIRRLSDELGETEPVVVSELDADVHDLAGLAELHAQLRAGDTA